MSKHEVRVTENSFAVGDSAAGKRVTFSKGIIVEPPIVVGEHFSRAILGPDADGVALHHVVSTEESTVFMASATENHERKTSDDSIVAIQTIARRIARLTDQPDAVIDLMVENPFPEYRGRPR